MIAEHQSTETLVSHSEALLLNVDDYIPGRYARSKWLRQAGYQVIEAGTGHECLALIEAHNPALILLDVNLPDINGFDVCREIRNNPLSANATVLHFSASSIMAQHQVRGLDSGADGYIVEPVEPAVLIATVNAFLRARRAEEALRKSNEEMRWFSYRMGHDLNEPLRTISAFTHLLRSKLAGQPDPEIDVYLDFISASADRVRSFMDGLLKYLQASHEVSGAQLVEAETLLSKARANLAGAITVSRALITSDALPCVYADENLLHVFQNLISNAIKYSREGVPPQVHVSAEGDSRNWTFSVRDNGIGIEPEYSESIFRIFQRLHSSKIAGHGIGLALARRVVEVYGGRMWFESVPGAGSTFYFTIPRRDSVR